MGNSQPPSNITSGNLYMEFHSQKTAFTTIIKNIDMTDSNNRIHISAFTYGHRGIHESILRAMKRGVGVVMLLDKNQLINGNTLYMYQRVVQLHNNGCIVVLSRRPHHMKCCLIEKKINGIWLCKRILVGSFNMTDASSTKNEIMISVDCTGHDAIIKSILHKAFEGGSFFKPKR